MTFVSGAGAVFGMMGDPRNQQATRSPTEAYEIGVQAQKAAPDNINQPKHYKSHPSGVECITITEHMSFLRGNAMKYLWRADHKNGLEDLEKARWYLDREIANLKRAK